MENRRIELVKKGVASLLILSSVLCISFSNRQKADLRSDGAARLSKDQGLKLLGNRFFTFSTVVRVNQIETSRDKTDGMDEAGVHGPEEARTFRETIGKVWPGGYFANMYNSREQVNRGSGVRGSEPGKEIRWFMNKEFRLALLSDTIANTPEQLIDFTRYDLKAQEPDFYRTIRFG